jgi:antitoxin (DNA-binding transcriptional repressor) of toxin-antitoxin stability system
MRTVGIKVLKNKLSEYLRLVERGETVMVTDRDRVVAELRPPREVPFELAKQRGIAGLIREGLAAPARRTEGRPPRAPIKGLTLKKLLREIERDRGER